MRLIDILNSMSVYPMYIDDVEEVAGVGDYVVLLLFANDSTRLLNRISPSSRY